MARRDRGGDLLDAIPIADDGTFVDDDPPAGALRAADAASTSGRNRAAARAAVVWLRRRHERWNERPRCARRRYLVSGALSFAAMASLCAAGFGLRDAQRLDQHASIWADVRATDRDVAFAARVLGASLEEHGSSASLEAHRERLYVAAESRYRALESELGDQAPLLLGGEEHQRATKVLRRLIGDTGRLSHSARTTDRAGDVGVAIERLRRRYNAPVGGGASDTRDARAGRGLPEATALAQSLSQYTDGRTGLRIGAIADDDSFWLIDVDRSTSSVKAIPGLTPTTTVTAFADQFVLADGGRLRGVAIPSTGPATSLWERPGDHTVTSSDGRSIWVQRGSTVDRLDEQGIPLSSNLLPEGARILVADPDGGVIAIAIGVGFVRLDDSGALDGPSLNLVTPGAIDLLDPARFPTPGPNQRNRSFGAFVDEGLIRVVRLRGGDADPLRADLPHMRTLAVLP